MRTTEKTCFKCGISKPMTEFYVHKQMADGHLNKCKECTKQDEKKRRHGDGRKYVLDYDRKRASLPHRREQAKRINTEWKTAHPNRRSAQIAVGNAVRDGKVKPLPCLICGMKAEAHHPDYSDPLYPVWLCSAHHKQAHALGKKIMQEGKYS
jgi:hypothetical protein